MKFHVHAERRGVRQPFRAGRSHSHNDGYALLVILVVLSVLAIGLARAVPSWKVQIQRERESRAIDHAREYRTAIKRYFHKYGRYPPSIEILAQKDGQGLRYLRQVWPDPIASGEGGSSSGPASQTYHGWKVIHYGQAVSGEIVDQPPAAATGLGTIAGPNLTGSKQGSAQAFGASSGFSAMGAPSPGSGSGAPATGATRQGPMPQGIAEVQAASGAQAPAPDSDTGKGTAGGESVGPAGFGRVSATAPGATMGGGPVIGVAPASSRPAVHEFNGFDQPDHWQFVYNYAQDPSLRTTAPAGNLNQRTPNGSSGMSPVGTGAPSPAPPSGAGTGGGAASGAGMSFPRSR